MSCKCAIETDEYHGWECGITGGACMFLIPSSRACAEKYGEGPDAGTRIWKTRRIIKMKKLNENKEKISKKYIPMARIGGEMSFEVKLNSGK